MEVTVTFFAVDMMSGRKADIPVTINDGATAAQLAEECIKNKIININISDLVKHMIWVNGSMASFTTILADGDQITFMRLLAGG